MEKHTNKIFVTKNPLSNIVKYRTIRRSNLSYVTILVLLYISLPTGYSGDLNCFYCRSYADCSSNQRKLCVEAEACSWVVKYDAVILRGCVLDGALQHFHEAQKNAHQMKLGNIYTCVTQFCNSSEKTYHKSVNVIIEIMILWTVRIVCYCSYF